MDTNFNNNSDKFAEEINKRIPNLTCPLCNKTEFTLVEGYFAHDVQSDLISRKLGGRNVPVVPIACKYCGLIIEFSAAILGFLPEASSETGK